MYTIWTKHLAEDQKQRFRDQIIGSKDILERLMDILKDEEKTLDRSETDIKSFDVPNWDYKQAYKNGYRAAIGVMLKLINLDQQEI